MRFPEQYPRALSKATVKIEMIKPAETAHDEILRLVDQAIAEHGKDHIDTVNQYADVHWEILESEDYVPEEVFTPACLVGQILAYKGVPLRTLALEWESSGVREILHRPDFPEGWAEERELLSFLQVTNDRGESWGSIRAGANELL